MKRERFLEALGIFFLLILAACAPRALPPPATPAPAKPETNTSPATLTASVDTGWEELIANAKKEGTVTVYSFGFIGDLGSAARVAFKDKYGINLDFVTGTGSQLIPRIQAEYRAGMYVADVLEGADINAIFAKKQALTAPYGDLPELRNGDMWVVDPRFDKEGQIISYTYTNYPLWINTKLLSPVDAPKSWDSFLNPKWKGKIVVTHPDTMPVLGRIWVALHHLGFSDDYFQQLGSQDLVIAPDARENDAMVARGQYPMTITSPTVEMAPLIADGAPIVPVNIAEGIASLPNPTVTLLAKAPHPNASRLFFNWLLSKGGQEIHGKSRSVASIRKDVADYSPPQMRIKYAKLVQLSQQDEEEAARIQADRVLSKMWAKK